MEQMEQIKQTKQIKQIDQMNIVVIGHVDHGKSTVIGRLLSDTGSLPEGKLEQVKMQCRKSSRPFEYAFLLDALKDEQSQGITIDSARCFFKTAKRNYIIIDAPGHIEFLKNMITGASRAEAALLVIDANEGVQENSRRHGFMASLLGIKQLVVLVNKLDISGYSESVYNGIRSEFTMFLDSIEVSPLEFIPISAREGENIAVKSDKMPWYRGMTVIQRLDEFKKEKPLFHKPFRMPVQDIYKFTMYGDDRRIVAGTVSSGKISAGDEVVFLPSGKKSEINSVEAFNSPVEVSVSAGRAAGFTLKTQIYIHPGEIMCRTGDELPFTSTAFRANLFWVGKSPMIPGKKYKLKAGTMKASVYLKEIINIIDASSLDEGASRSEILRHDVSECILQTLKPVSFDRFSDNELTGRFVIVDGYEIAGGGIIMEPVQESLSYLAEHAVRRDYRWVKGNVAMAARHTRFSQKPRIIVFTGEETLEWEGLAQALEQDLWREGRNVYYLGLSNILRAIDNDGPRASIDREEEICRLGESAHLLADAGLIVITTISGLDNYEYGMLKLICEPHEILLINAGIVSADTIDALSIDSGLEAGEALSKIKTSLRDRDIIPDFQI